MLDRTQVEALMKRCQIGVGGRNALDNAHSIMADCYGTLGRLLNDELKMLSVCGRLARGSMPCGAKPGDHEGECGGTCVAAEAERALAK